MKQQYCHINLNDSQHTKAGDKPTDAMQKYAEAVNLYSSSDLSLRQIAEHCGVTPRGLGAHISRHFRPLLFARYGLDADTPAGLSLQVKPPKGQSLKTHLKYKDAIQACGDMAFIELNVSQIARLFGLSGPGLASQLRVHYPSVIPDRERLRRRLGLADNTPRGSRPASKEAYGEAAKMYRDTDLTISQVAEECGVSPSGFSQFMRFYHHDIIKAKAKRRSESRCKPGERKAGALSGSGRPYGPNAATVALYADALEMYRSTCLTIEEIAQRAGVTVEGLRGYLFQWHRGEKLRRRGYEWDGISVPDLSGTRPFLKSTRGKYAPAIASLKERPRDVAQAAAEFGLNPDVFRAYLRTHEPDLAASRGMLKRPDGKAVKRASEEKYRAAIEEYSTSADSLRLIAKRHGIVYNSLSSFIARNCPEERERHSRAMTQASTINSIENQSSFTRHATQ